MPFNPYANFCMKDHVVFITGAGQNIGAEIAHVLAGAGAAVAVTDREAEKAKQTAAKIHADTGSPTLGLGCNVLEEDDIQTAIQTTVGTFGALTTLINNVGWGEVNPDPVAVPTDKMIAAFKLNTISALRVTQAAEPYLLKAKNASITNSGSRVATAPAFDFLAYGTAKAALIHMMRSLAHYYAGKIRINNLIIGTVPTAGYAAAGIDEATKAKLFKGMLVERPGTPRDIADAVLWLASPAGSWVSGQDIEITGGGRRIRLLPEDHC